MALQNIFSKASTEESLSRLEKLTPNTQPLWGKMNAAQMLAHLNVAYDMTYGKIVPNNSFLTKLMLKLFVKNAVVSEIPYPKNSRTAPAFVIADQRDFEKEKAILMNRFSMF